MHPWRERLARWFTPIARVCPLSPNAITVIALLINAGAALLLALGSRWPAGFLVAIVLISIAGFADALDGVVARVQQKESRFGQQPLGRTRFFDDNGIRHSLKMCLLFPRQFLTGVDNDR